MRSARPAAPAIGPHGAVLQRRKPTLAWVAATYRLVHLSRRVLPNRWILRLSLNTAWLARRIAWEEAFRRHGHAAGIGYLRPHALPLLESLIDSGDDVVDLGCGAGFASEMAAGKARRVVAIDNDPVNASLTAARCMSFDNVEVVTASWSAGLIGRGPFDLGLILHVLEHLDEPEAVLRELKDHCARLLVEVPDVAAEPLNFVRSDLGLPFANDADHVSEFTAAGLRHLLEQAGWAVERLESLNGSLVAAARTEDDGST